MIKFFRMESTHAYSIYKSAVEHLVIIFLVGLHPHRIFLLFFWLVCNYWIILAVIVWARAWMNVSFGSEDFDNEQWRGSRGSPNVGLACVTFDFLYIKKKLDPFDIKKGWS